MATTLVWTCPLCGLSLKTVSSTGKGDASKDPHVHIEFVDEAECLNGHRWKVQAELIFERVN